MTPRLIRIAVSASIAALFLALAPWASAAPEQGDAGDLRATAQDLGSEAVTTITGAYVSAADADMYRICLTDGGSFSASTVGATTLDTQLFLLTADGHGVYANDDWNLQRGSRLPADHRFSPTQGGEHYLAISSFNRDPQSIQGEIFQDSFSPILYPDRVIDANGFGGAGAHIGWHGREAGMAGSYTITLTGTRVCVPPDTTPPTIDLRSPVDGARVKQGADVEVDFSCADEGGSGLESCVGSTADGAKLDTSALGDVAVTVTARDKAGNQTVVEHTVTVVDETAPAVRIDSPVDGGVYVRGEAVSAGYSCSDEPGGSGVASCEGTVANGAAIDTASVGVLSFEVRTSDNAGNTDSKTVSYSVAYDFDGFFAPVQNPPMSNRWKAGAPVPIRFSLGGYQGPHPEAAGYPQSTACGGGDAEPVKRKPVFEYERRSGRYRLLWKTERRWAGSCREFVLKLDDGSVHSARFQFVRRTPRDRHAARR